MPDMIHIALAANHRYVNGLLVTMVSMMRSATDKSRLQFHVFSDGLLPEDKERVLAFSAEYRVPTPRFVEPDMSEIAANFAATTNYPLTVFIRLFYCDILSDLDWVVYTDVDTLWLRDVCELWQLRDETSTVHLHLISPPHLSIIGNGDPAYESYLKTKAERLGIANTITWLGYVNNEAKYAIYAKSDLLVHPTVFDNNGMVAAEALCTGLPVVMQDLLALRDVYTTGCLKVPFGDRQAFTAAIVELATDPAKLAETAPTPDQIAVLRAHWDWGNRAAEFARWLNAIDS